MSPILTIMGSSYSLVSVINAVPQISKNDTTCLSHPKETDDQGLTKTINMTNCNTLTKEVLYTLMKSCW